MLLRVERGKGGRYRNAMLPSALLREWWKVGQQEGVLHVDGWLFPGQHYLKPLSTRQLHRIVVDASVAAGIGKRVGPHIRRFLLHVLPQGFHRIRPYALLAGAARKAHLDHVCQLLGVAPPAAADMPTEPDEIRPPCPCCGGRMVVVETFERQRQPRVPPARTLLSGTQAS